MKVGGVEKVKAGRRILIYTYLKVMTLEFADARGEQVRIEPS